MEFLLKFKFNNIKVGFFVVVENRIKVVMCVWGGGGAVK